MSKKKVIKFRIVESFSALLKKKRFTLQVKGLFGWVDNFRNDGEVEIFDSEEEAVKKVYSSSEYRKPLIIQYPSLKIL